MDVRIVGGGAGGLITGLQILDRRPDADVTVYEREPEPYTTLCGEGISQQSLERFQPVFDSLPYVAHTFDGAEWWWPGGHCIQVDQPCYTLARHDWIPAMADAFEERGGQIQLGKKISPDDAQALADEADLVVGADGPGSQVRETMTDAEIVTRLGIQYRVEGSDFETNNLMFYTDKRYTPEYAWVFPRGEVDNVGLLAESGDDWEKLDRFMEDKGVGGEVVKREAYPIGFMGTKVQEDNRVLIGDAGGLTNPLTKGGLAAIIFASEILADCVERDRIDAYGDRIMDHPITSPLFERAVGLIMQWDNDKIEHLMRHLPQHMVVGPGRSKRPYWGEIAKSFLTNPGHFGDLLTLYKAFGYSRQYSW